MKKKKITQFIIIPNLNKDTNIVKKNLKNKQITEN